MPVRILNINSVLLSLFLMSAGSIQLHAKAQSLACAGPESKTGSVEKITKFNDIILKGGERLFLANVTIPETDHPEQPLQFLIGKQVSYAFSGRQKDRHNRLIVQIMVQGPEPFWLQSWLIEKGLAQAIAIPNNISCSEKLLQQEKLARKNQAGEWATGHSFKIIKADDLPLLKRQPQGSFQIIRGKLHNIGHSGSNTFLNFSDNWRHDFTAVISSRLLSRKDSQWPKLKPLIGKTVQIRGWLDFWNGPMIRLHTPMMLEVENNDLTGADQ